MGDSDSKIIKLSKKIDELVKEGKKDGNPKLPKYPSAQMYHDMRKKDKLSLKQVVEAEGEDWEEYEVDMKAHWPVTAKAKRPRFVPRRRIIR